MLRLPLRATLSTNGIPVRRERTVRPEPSGAKSKGEPHSALLLPPQTKGEEDSLSLPLARAQPQPLAAVLVRQHGITPVAAVEIPADRLGDSLVKVMAGRPGRTGLVFCRL